MLEVCNGYTYECPEGVFGYFFHFQFANNHKNLFFMVKEDALESVQWKNHVDHVIFDNVANSVTQY